MTKQNRVLEALRNPAGINRFNAEYIGDHALNSTISRLRSHGHNIIDQWETVPTKYCIDGVRVKRYWLIAE